MFQNCFDLWTCDNTLFGQSNWDPIQIAHAAAGYQTAPNAIGKSPSNSYYGSGYWLGYCSNDAANCLWNNGLAWANNQCDVDGGGFLVNDYGVPQQSQNVNSPYPFAYVFGLGSVAPVWSLADFLSWTNCTTLSQPGNYSEICTDCQSWAIPDNYPTVSATAYPTAITIVPTTTTTAVESTAVAPTTTSTPPVVLTNTGPIGPPPVPNPSDYISYTQQQDRVAAWFLGVAGFSIGAAVDPVCYVDFAGTWGLSSLFQGLGLGAEGTPYGMLNAQLAQFSQETLNSLSAIQTEITNTYNSILDFLQAAQWSSIQAQLDCNTCPLGIINTMMSQFNSLLSQTTESNRVQQAGCPWNASTYAVQAWSTGTSGLQNAMIGINTAITSATNAFFPNMLQYYSDQFASNPTIYPPGYVATQMLKGWAYWAQQQNQAMYMLSSYASLCGAYNMSAGVVQWNSANLQAQFNLLNQYLPHALLTMAGFNFTSGYFQMGAPSTNGIPNSDYYCVVNNYNWASNAPFQISSSPAGQTCAQAANATLFKMYSAFPNYTSAQMRCKGCVLANIGGTAQKAGISQTKVPEVGTAVTSGSFQFMVGGTRANTFMMVPVSSTQYNVFPYDQWLGQGLIGTTSTPAQWYTNITGTSEGDWTGTVFNFVESVTSQCAEAWAFGTNASLNYCNTMCPWGGNFSLANNNIFTCSGGSSTTTLAPPYAFTFPSAAALCAANSGAYFQGLGACLVCNGTQPTGITGPCPQAATSNVCVDLNTNTTAGSICGTCSCASQPIPGPVEFPLVIAPTTVARAAQKGKVVPKINYFNGNVKKFTIKNNVTEHIDIYGEAPSKQKGVPGKISWVARIPPNKSHYFNVASGSKIRARRTRNGQILSGFLVGSVTTGQSITVSDNSCRAGATSYNTPGGCCCAPDSVITKTVTGTKLLLRTAFAKAKATPIKKVPRNIGGRVKVDDSSASSEPEEDVILGPAPILPRDEPESFEESVERPAATSQSEQHHLEARHLCAPCTTLAVAAKSKFCCPPRKKITLLQTKFVTKTSTTTLRAVATKKA